MTGHTTLLSLCGFAYGMKGFLGAAPASLVASTIVFVALRYLFSGVIRSWSEKNETWKALEAVIVSFFSLPFPIALADYHSGCQRSSPHHSHQDISFPTVGILKCPLCSESSPTICTYTDKALTVAWVVYTVRVSLAIHGSNNLQLSEGFLVHLHRYAYGFVVRRKAEGTYGHW